MGRRFESAQWLAETGEGEKFIPSFPPGSPPGEVLQDSDESNLRMSSITNFLSQEFVILHPVKSDMGY
jgi:hypothetical protein